MTAAKPKESTRGFRVKRVYEAAAKEDGFRVLVDRLWPRGLTKEKARLDRWLKEISPSDTSATGSMTIRRSGKGSSPRMAAS